jgi:hypothetical protein
LRDYVANCISDGDLHRTLGAPRRWARHGVMKRGQIYLPEASLRFRPTGGAVPTVTVT